MKRVSAFLLLYSLVFHFSTTAAIAGQTPKLGLNSEAAILMDADTGVILYQKNIEEKLYPASITKVMTALVALNAVGDQTDVRIGFSEQAVDLPPDSSTIYMLAGDTLSFTEALYGLMIASANEIANAIAENTAESYDRFIEDMNREAALLGAKNTHFVNPSGLYDMDHYTCAYDMALFMREAVKNPVFVDAISKVSYDIPPTERQPDSRPLYTLNKLMTPGGAYSRDYFIGSKSGYVDESKHTLATYAEQDGHRLISIVLRAEKNKDYEDTITLMDYGFSSYRYVTVLDAASVTASAVVVLDPENPKSNRSVALYAKEDVEGDYPACINEQTINIDYKIPDYIVPPVQTGEPLGALLVKYQDITLMEIGLYASENIAKPEPTIMPLPVAASVEPELDNPRYAGGFSFGFLGDIFSSIISSFSPVQLDPLYPMIILISITMIIMVYLMNVVIHGKNRNREKELLKYINRGRKK
ncbi:MAG: D-alanyl-D-alanine carboxypeptidase [Clostridiales bacterium]|jgi:D-alanyl-D-alanine carboxypeptidase|nr:D-alanyl-D-alanine carboxypeptidase [Clostridiales bacterium]